jgi:hypothetical protein
VPFHHRTVKERLVALEVSHPEPVRSWWGKVPLDQVGCGGGLWVAAGQPVPPAPVAALEASNPHQPGHPFAAHLHGWAILHDLAVPGSRANIDHW